MIKKLLTELVGKERRASRTIRERIVVEERPDVLYAIGDVHGCHRLLKDLERRIFEDAAGIEGEKWVVCLGDYIDRGPSSAQVLDHLLSPMPAGFKRICLAGNHEQFAYEYLCGDYGNGWLDFGGREALASYGLYDIDKQPARLAKQIIGHVPEEHIEFLGTLPTMLSMPGFVFVHAGLDPKLTLENQRDGVLLWSRPWDFPWPVDGTGYRVIHGHTPVTETDLSQARINIDLGAYASGTLCALKLTRDGEMSTILTV